MSIEAMSWVLQHSPTSGTEKVVLLGIASHADQTGRNAWPSVTTLARYARVHERGVQKALRRLVDGGHLVIEHQRGGFLDGRNDRRPNRYRVVFDGVLPPGERGGPGDTPPDDHGVALRTPRGGAEDANGVALGTPELSLEPSYNRPTESPLPPTARPGHPAPLVDMFRDPSVATITEGIDAMFDAFWSRYPRKVGKPHAKRAFANACRRAAPTVIASGLARHLVAWTLWPESDRQFIPYPASWLNRDGWDDETPPARAPRGSRRDAQVDDLADLAAAAYEDEGLDAMRDLTDGPTPGRLPGSMTAPPALEAP